MDTETRGDIEFGTIPGLVLRSSERFGDAAALIDGDKTLSYRALLAEVRRAARALVGAGVQAGDRVAMWAPNSWEWAVAALAITYAGAVLVPINTRYKGHEAAYILGKSRAVALFTLRDFLGVDHVAMLRQCGVELPSLRHVVALRGDAGDAVSWGSFLAGADAVDPAEVERRREALLPSDVGDILFTSGTTGHPKGVPTRHEQSLRAFREWAEIAGLRPGDRYLVVPPFFHTFGYKAGLLAALMMGATVFPHAVFDVNAVLERVAREKISVLPGPPSLYQSILLHPDRAKHDLSALRLAVTGAAAIREEMIVQMRQEMSFETILTAYGLTEGTGVATMCRRGDDPKTIASTSGRAIPGVEVRVVDDAGDEVPRGTPGEIVVRGYTVMSGYFEAPEATAEAIDPHGFLHTGDVGVMDERGYIQITDRKKDMFIVGGFNAYPAEIEAQIAQHPAVAAVAVVGMPDERLGEVGAAFVVPRPGASPSADELIAFCRERMANFKVPRRVEIVSALPMNASGKVLKYQLRQSLRVAPG